MPKRMVSTRKRPSAALFMRRGLDCSICRGTCCARDAAACSRRAPGLKTLNHAHYYCSLCAENYEPTLDKLVEVTFTVNQSVRRIAAHDPDSLPYAEYMRQIFWSSSNDVPEDVESAIQRVTLDVMELGPGEKAAMSLTLPKGFAIVFDPVTHSSLFLEVDGEETRERRNLSLVFADAHAHNGTLKIQPGPARISFENKAARRTMPGIWLHSDEMDKLTGHHLPFLTATRLLSNQAFRDLYRSGTFDPRAAVQDHKPYDPVHRPQGLDRALRPDRRSRRLRSRAQSLRGGARRGLDEGGAVVKTIGDAVMATFPSPDRALRAAMRMREAMREINQTRGGEDLALNIGLHSGPCLAVMLDDRQDYFGQTVNIASRVNELADPTAILATKPIIESSEVARVLSEASYRTTPRSSQLRGLSDEFEIFRGSGARDRRRGGVSRPALVLIGRRLSAGRTPRALRDRECATRWCGAATRRSRRR